MMRRSVSPIALICCLFGPMLMAGIAGCGSSASSPGAVGGSTTVPPTLTSVSPTIAYRGRPTTLQIEGAGTDFDDSTVATVSGVTILSHHAAAPGSLQLSVFVPADLASAAVDIDVGGIALKAALSIDDPVVISGAVPRAPAGYSLSLHLINRDLAHPFSDSALHLDAGPGIVFEVTSVTANDALVVANIAPTAAKGARDLTVILDDSSDGSDPSGDAGSGDASSPSSPASEMKTIVKGALLVDPLSTLPIASDSPIDVTVPGGAEGGLLEASGLGKKLLDLHVTSAVRADGAPALPLLALLDPSIGLVQPLSALASDELLVMASSSGDPLLFVGPADFGTVALTRFHVILHAVDATSATEVEPNDAITNATNLTLPFVASGQLASQTDTDVFAFSVTTAGTLVLRTQSTALDSTDTQIEVLDGGGTVIASNEDEDPAANDVSSFLRIPVTTGSFYCRVRSGHSTSVFGAFTLLGEVR